MSKRRPCSIELNSSSLKKTEILIKLSYVKKKTKCITLGHFV